MRDRWHGCSTRQWGGPDLVRPVSDTFPKIRFAGQLRPSQQDVARIAQKQLEAGERRLHIVAPPGSGKTVVGLYLWAECIGCPAVVLSPNSAIQAQWAARTSLFRREDGKPLATSVSTTASAPGLLTSLTYQSVTLPGEATDELDARAVQLWVAALLESQQAATPDAAEAWLADLQRHNPEHYRRRLGHYRKRVRDADVTSGAAMDALHASAQETLLRLKHGGVGLLILDECHHLMGHWGRVLSEVEEYLGDPVIVGLTATPPDRTGRAAGDIERYDRFFGPIDYEVPVPAVVKDGFLAPYQDLAYFVRPTPDELAFIARSDQQVAELVGELCAGQLSPPADPAEASDASDALEASDDSTRESMPLHLSEPLPRWLLRVLGDRQLPGGAAKDWHAFERRDGSLAQAAVWFLTEHGWSLPHDVPEPIEDPEDETEFLVTVIDRYVRHGLRRSPHPADHALAERAVDRLRLLGVQITDTGHRPCASPVSRVIAYTRSKTDALVPILTRERELLGETIRAVVIADYEKTSATSSEVAHLLDDEAGGAVAAFRTILADAGTNPLDPILLTGSTVLVDSDLSQRILFEAGLWLEQRSMSVELTRTSRDGFCVLSGSGADWCPRVYVELLTEMFQRGLTRCLVGTRGLLGEGWDANTINVLVDLSTVTTSMTVNQLRGRSIRLDPRVPDKLANNWDVVCIAPEFVRGLDDYRRFIRKHQTVFGICDDGAIEKGVGHVHAAFTELAPELVDGSVTALNADMLSRAGRREHVYGLWKVGEPYQGRPLRTVEIRTSTGGASDENVPLQYPPFAGSRAEWTPRSLAMAVGEAVLAALYQTGQLSGAWPVAVSEREGGFVRVFLENADEADAAKFATAFREAMGPPREPRYVIPRFVDSESRSVLSRLLPAVLRRLFVKRKRNMLTLHAVPTDLARKRQLVDVYQKCWNQFVSPGDAVFARNADGAALLDRALREGLVTEADVHDKEIFV